MRNYGNYDLGHEPPIDPPDPPEYVCQACEAGYLDDSGVCQECGAEAKEPEDPENYLYDLKGER